MSHTIRYAVSLIERQDCAIPTVEKGGQGCVAPLWKRGAGGTCSSQKGNSKSSPTLLLQRREHDRGFAAPFSPSKGKASFPGKALLFPSLKKGGRGGFALRETQQKILPNPPFTKEGARPRIRCTVFPIEGQGVVPGQGVVVSPFEKGGQGGFALREKQQKILPNPPFTKEGARPRIRCTVFPIEGQGVVVSPFEKGLQGGFSLREKQQQILPNPPFAKEGARP